MVAYAQSCSVCYIRGWINISNCSFCSGIFEFKVLSHREYIRLRTLRCSVGRWFHSYRWAHRMFPRRRKCLEATKINPCMHAYTSTCNATRLNRQIVIVNVLRDVLHEHTCTKGHEWCMYTHTHVCVQFCMVCYTKEFQKMHLHVHVCIVVMSYLGLSHHSWSLSAGFFGHRQRVACLKQTTMTYVTCDHQPAVAVMSHFQQLCHT